MLVLDFLQLISDLRKQTRFYFKKNEDQLSLLQPEIITINNQPCLVIKTAKNRKSLQQWELLVLLDRPTYRPLPLYLEIDGQYTAVYGFKIVGQDAFLN